jgi:hypothetical protein
MRAASALEPTPHRFDMEASPAYECVIAAAIRLNCSEARVEVRDISSSKCIAWEISGGHFHSARTYLQTYGSGSLALIRNVFPIDQTSFHSVFRMPSWISGS